jgi:hypothetical protein
MNELRLEVYKTIFETWRYEVDSYWQRNSYFAAFETGALAGCWYVVEHGYHGSGLAFALAGLASTIVWWVTSIAVHRYIEYWWESVQKVEQKLALENDGFDFATKHTGSRGLHASTLVLIIPILFAGSWLVILLFAIRSLCSCKAGTP